MKKAALLATIAAVLALTSTSTHADDTPPTSPPRTISIPIPWPTIPPPAPCTFTDAYGYTFTCAQWAKLGDPCTAGGSTLYYIQPCDTTNPPIARWCAKVPKHPVCQNLHLPKTGTAATLGLTAGALALILTGSIIITATRRPPRPRP